MKIEELIEHNIKSFPTLFQRREQVLNHLYCTNGNGYKWCDGGLEPVSIGGKLIVESKKYETELDAAKRCAKEIYTPNGDPVKYWLRLNKEMRNELKKPPLYYYPLCEFSKLCTIPDNVRPDYLDGAMEVINLILDLPIRLKKPIILEHPLDFPNRENKKIARVVRKELKKRKGK